jgi:molecular chaperone GrpE
MKKKEKKQSEQKNEEIIPEDNSIEIERNEPEEKEPEQELPKTESQEEDKNIESELVERINELEDKNKELNDRLLRRAAEFENYKKRTENDQLNLLKYAGKEIILKVLSVYDDLHRSLAHVDDDENSNSVKDGLVLVTDNFKKILDDLGVKKIEAKGNEFDFNLHEALMRQPDNSVEPNTVLEEVEPGYMYKDLVIKHTKVVVSVAAEEEKTEEDTEEKSE